MSFPFSESDERLIMAVVEVKVPSVGESVQEGMIHKWHKKNGEAVKTDEVILELETDKATVEVVAPASGVLQTLKKEGETVKVGELIAKVDSAGTPAAVPSAPAAKAPETKPTPSPAPAAQPAVVTQIAKGPAASPPPASTVAAGTLSPAVRRLVAEHQIPVEQVAATGKGGRVTKPDVIGYMSQQASQPATNAAAARPAAATATAAAPVKAVAPAPAYPVIGTEGVERGVRREPMSMLRRRIAERLVQAQHTAAILTTFNEVDMTAVMALRTQYKDSFKEKHGVSLGFMGFFVKAVIAGLKQFPALNGWIEGNEIVYHDYCDIGVAVSSDRGLVVPVVRNAEKMSIAQLESAIGYFAAKARDGKITVDDLTGGTFTVSNGGVFGSLMSTPILNPPQSGILGMHKIEQRPVVVNNAVVVRPMMYLAVSYDHRIVDGKEAVQFLVKVKECIEDPQRLLLEV